jgi:hypothetical protein
MKKIIFGIVFIAAVAAAWNFSQNRDNVELPNLALANVEALADGESTIRGCCPGGGLCEYNGVPLINVYPCQV